VSITEINYILILSYSLAFYHVLFLFTTFNVFFWHAGTISGKTIIFREYYKQNQGKRLLKRLMNGYFLKKAGDRVKL